MKDPVKMKAVIALVLFFLGLVAAEEAVSKKYLYSDLELGIYNVTSCSGAPSCGKSRRC